MTQNTVNYGGLSIPGPQAQPPAGHDDIAFRPACNQVGAMMQANGLVAHTINLPDGSLRTLVEMPPMSGADAVREMDAMGLCKVGGIDVPIIFTNQLPQQSIAQVTASVAEAAPDVAVAEEIPTGLPLIPIVMGAVLLISAVGTAIYWRNRTPVPAQSPLVTPPPADAAPAVASGEDLIDQLWGD